MKLASNTTPMEELILKSMMDLEKKNKKLEKEVKELKYEVLAYKLDQDMSPLEALENKILPFYKQKIKEIKENKDSKPKKELMRMLCDLKIEIYGLEESIYDLGTHGGPFRDYPSRPLREIILSKVYELKEELENE